MLEIESLRYELVKVSKKVKRHSVVADKANISVTYLHQIRKGTNVTLDSSQNQGLISNLITIYRKLGVEEIRQLKKALQ